MGYVVVMVWVDGGLRKQDAGECECYKKQRGRSHRRTSLREANDRATNASGKKILVLLRNPNRVANWKLLVILRSEVQSLIRNSDSQLHSYPVTRDLDVHRKTSRSSSRAKAWGELGIAAPKSRIMKILPQVIEALGLLRNIPPTQ